MDDNRHGVTAQAVACRRQRQSPLHGALVQSCGPEGRRSTNRNLIRTTLTSILLQTPPMQLASSSSTRVQGCSFSDPQFVKELTGSKSRIVELYFNSCDGRALYVHPAFLSAWSGVLRDLLEGLGMQEADTASQHDQSSKPRMQHGFESAGYATIPLDDTETAAWEDALALMHPSPQLFWVSWDSAARLLLLAHKYDMPAITACVEAFLMEKVNVYPDHADNASSSILGTSTQLGSSTSMIGSNTARRAAPRAGYREATPEGIAGNPASSTPCCSSFLWPITIPRLAAHLSADTAAEWLQLASMCDLDAAADICITHMITHQVPLDISMLSGLQRKHADQLLSGLQQQLQAVTEKAAAQEKVLAAAALPIKTPTRKARCPACRSSWYKLPDGKSTSHCLSCGAKRPIILGELYQP